MKRHFFRRATDSFARFTVAPFTRRREQDPAKADKITKIQRDLDETTEVLVSSIKLRLLNHLLLKFTVQCFWFGLFLLMFFFLSLLLILLRSCIFLVLVIFVVLFVLALVIVVVFVIFLFRILALVVALVVFLVCCLCFLVLILVLVLSACSCTKHANTRGCAWCPARHLTRFTPCVVRSLFVKRQ